MKYLCLIYHAQSMLDAISPSELSKMQEGIRDFLEELQEKGQLVDVNRLKPVRTATTVRMREGKLSTTDGPFAETKEQLLGYLLIEAGDLNEAIRIIARFPSTRFGSVEIRPIEDSLYV
ncbi:MAG TPA: YciI family protein [Thermoanaerobaculia bacterium]|jgi:hypothetical protein|nr:YciI family protein [Thermoanaerobaculia bacterium]